MDRTRQANSGHQNIKVSNNDIMTQDIRAIQHIKTAHHDVTSGTAAILNDIALAHHKRLFIKYFERRGNQIREVDVRVGDAVMKGFPCQGVTNSDSQCQRFIYSIEFIHATENRAIVRNGAADRLTIIIITDQFPPFAACVIDTRDASSHFSAQTTGTIDSNLLDWRLWTGCGILYPLDIMHSYPTWVAIGYHIVRDIMNDHTAGTDNTPSADFYTGYHDCTGANPSALTNVNISTKRSLWRDMSIVPDNTLVVNRCTGINNTVFTNSSTTLYDSTLHNDRAILYRCERRYHRRWVNRLAKFTIQPLGNLLAVDIIANTYYYRGLTFPRVPYRDRLQLADCDIIIKQRVNFLS